MIYILFGEMGSGKNYVGEKLAKKLNCPFLDGDTLIQEEMMIKVLGFNVFKKDCIEGYVKDYLIPEILNLAIDNDDVVVSQALYARSFRQSIVDAVNKDHLLQLLGKDKVKLIWVKTPLLLNLRQLLSRQRGIGWLLYFFITTLFFQRPGKEAIQINNNRTNNLDLLLQSI